MPSKSQARRVLKILLISSALMLVLFVGFTFVFFFVGGGYWENMQGLDRFSGPMRFKQFVCDPIPENIFDVRGGYSGFPQGFVGIRLKYAGDFPVDSCLRDWTQIGVRELDHIVSGKIAVEQITRVFVQGERRKPGGYLGNRWNKYLLLDDKSRRGYLYVP